MQAAPRDEVSGLREHSTCKIIAGGDVRGGPLRTLSVQITNEAFTGLLEHQGVRISMDGKGRYIDNLFVERL